MALILETKNFKITAHDLPHHSRENGGHIVIWIKQHYAHRHELPVNLAAEFMYLTMIVGEAALTVMRSNGLDVVRVNYLDNGNWNYKKPDGKPEYHANLYIRTWGEKHPRSDPRFQAFPEALFFPDRATGYYEGFEPYTEQECEEMKQEILRLMQTDKYKDVLFEPQL